MDKGQYIPALGYDLLTPLYDAVVRLTTREKAFKRALIEQAQFRSGENILDLACGSGTLAILIKQKYAQTFVSGIDGDDKILRIAKNKAQRAKVNIHFEQGLSFALPYADMSFDQVVSSLFFHHLTRENKLNTLREVSRVLKPNGVIQIADWGLPDGPVMNVASRSIMLLDGAETTTDSFNGLLPSLVEEAGFCDVVETQHFNTLFGTMRLMKAKNRR